MILKYSPGTSQRLRVVMYLPPQSNEVGLLSPHCMIAYLLHVYRQDLSRTSLKLQDFRTLLENLVRNPSDSSKRVQLQETANVLKAYQRLLESDMHIINLPADLKMEFTQEEQATVNELITMIDKIRDGIQQFYSLDGRRCQEEDETMIERSSRQTTPETSVAAATMAEPSEAGKPLSATAMSIQAMNPAESGSAETTLGEFSRHITSETTVAAATMAEPSEARKPLSATTMPIQAMNPAPSGSPEINDVSRTLQEAKETLQLFRTLQRDINTSSANVVDATQKRDFQVVAERLEALQRKVQSLINAELGKCSADITGDDEAALANLMSVNDELQLCVKSYRRMTPKAETAMNWPPEATTSETATVATAAADISAEFTAKPPLTEADDVPQTLIEASEVLWQFMTFQQDMSSSSAHVADPAWMRELQIIGERLMRLQQKVDRLINAKLDENSTDSTEEAEKSLANLMKVNDELLFCVEDYQRTTRKYEMTLGRSTQQTTPETTAAAAATMTEPSAAQKPLSATFMPIRAINSATTLRRFSRRTASEAVAAAATVAKSPSTQKLLSATAMPISAMKHAESELAEAKRVSRTLQKAREIIGQFRTLKRDTSTHSVSAMDTTQMRDLQVVAEELEARQKKVQSLINALLGESSVDTIGDEEVSLAELISANDELQLCLGSCQRMARRSGMTLGKSSRHTAFEAATAAETVKKLPRAQKPWSAATISTQTMNPTERGLAEVNDASRTLREARRTLRLFYLLQQNTKSSSSVEINATQMRELQVVVERLKVLQEKVHALINSVMDGISTEITEDDERALASFTSLNDELLRCVKIYQQTARKYEARKSSQQPGDPTGHP